MLALVVLFIVAISAPFFMIAGRAWSGRSRRWAVDRPEYGAFHRLNYLPLKAGAAGIWVLSFIPGAMARVSGSDAAEAIEFYTVFPVGMVLVAAKFWWPAALAPQWQKEWVARGGDVGAVDVPLWGPGETVPERAKKKGLQ
ncbi:hypothetical protein EV380_3113 [Zhihengliuella halotolerans]|uniref:Uncharacterized protein n=1 Tax=Zhihengliuella halotolerans TaxID=370736 RepID=A0A4Q8AGK0_9MICC|nr:hypothetical protein EV380_3113 [Zhihengliuella halotolerans]